MPPLHSRPEANHVQRYEQVLVRDWHPVTLLSSLPRHPEIAMSSQKEMHLFDGRNYSSDWTPEQIDARYRRGFQERDGVRLRGEATPIYLFFPEIAGELKRYNPGLKAIVILRDPVERAISSYHSQENRGEERRPLWLALRLRRPHNPRAIGSITRICTYRRRGLYSRQLRNLFRHFDREEVLILRTRDLERHHDAVLRRVFAFLGVDEAVRIEPERANQADRGGRRHRIVFWLPRLTHLAEFARMRALARSHPDLAAREPLAPGDLNVAPPPVRRGSLGRLRTRVARWVGCFTLRCAAPVRLGTRCVTVPCPSLCEGKVCIPDRHPVR